MYLNYKDAVNNAWFNTNHCGEKMCPSESPIPEQPIEINLEDWDPDIAKYSAEIVYRIIKAGIDNLEIEYPPELNVIKELYNNDEDPVFGSIVQSSDDSPIWICFRGTQTNNEWSQNLKMQQEAYKSSSDQTEFKIGNNSNEPPLIHKGFMEIYNNIRKEILDTLEKTNNDKSRVIVVSGHSLGAAISTIVGFELSQKKYQVVVYNYASPRIGNKVFSDLINNSSFNVFRVVNTEDIVPNLPASVTANFKDVDKPFIYMHCGILKSFTDNWLSKLNNHFITIYMKGLESM